MIETLNFQTRARTLDHLGREQIADVPTAITELWKNSYDAYAARVNLSLYDASNDAKAVVAICDDGHGMSYEEFVSKWLVVGTETKLFGSGTPEEDKFGQKTRPKQGQKGIGRLSSAHLGPLLLLISKRKSNDFVIALIDWRIFENPYLILSDIKIPVTTIKNKDEIFAQIPSLFEKLLENVWGVQGLKISEEDRSRTDRVSSAWKIYDKSKKDEFNERKAKNPDLENWGTPSEVIADTIISSQFTERHLEAWPVWTEGASHGTVMLVSEVNPDFLAYLPEGAFTGTEKYIKGRFFQTLTAFVDPFHDDLSGTILSSETNGDIPDLKYEFDVVLGKKRESIIGTKLPFDRQRTNEMEHVLFGSIEENGDFRGCVKSFGKWRKKNYDYVIPKPINLKMPLGANGKLGRCDIYISTFEMEIGSSEHDANEHGTLKQLASQYSAFMIFRDGLRVLPYGREESDLFEIETRRSLNAGRYFWNKRRMFGRLALSRSENPNLRDKAGREGFIDNATAKTLKNIVMNILTQSASEYFGRESDGRKSDLPDIKQKNAEEKAAAKASKDADRVRKKRTNEFNSNVDKANRDLPSVIEDFRTRFSRIEIELPEDIEKANALLDIAREKIGELQVRGPRPKKLTRKGENNLESYNVVYSMAEKLIGDFVTRLDLDVKRIEPKQAWEILAGQIKRGSTSINKSLTSFEGKINELIDGEKFRIQELVNDRSTKLKTESVAILKLVKEEREMLSIASKKVENWRREFDDENSDFFGGYIFALESLKESIDLQNIAILGADENHALRAEVERLHELAQLGIAVEILGHELQSYDNMIGSGLNALPSETHSSRAFQSIETGYEGLTKQLNFLAPLKLSGRRSIKNISGKDIFEYLTEFFEELLGRRDILLSATDKFLTMSVFDQPARLFPVFINLVNNSQYWVFHSEAQNKQIVLDVIDGKVVVSDNGNGIDSVDQSKLFQLFFTRKGAKGRGVGLYLCRANLRAGGHDIEYISDSSDMPLSGANFAIQFSNVEFGGSK